MLQYYLDHHVHEAITAGLRRRGIDCVTLHDDRAQRLDDEAVLRRATELARILITQDEDFLTICHDWLSSGREFSGVVFSEQMGITIWISGFGSGTDCACDDSGRDEEPCPSNPALVGRAYAVRHHPTRIDRALSLLAV